MKRYIFILSMVAAAAVSCEKFIDVVPDKIGSLDNAFENRENARKFLHTCYSRLPAKGYLSVEGHFDDMTWSHRGVDWLFQYQYFALRDGNTASDPYCNNWNGLRGGNAMFEAIRDCNILIERIGEPIDMSYEERLRWAAEAKFLKAYYHFHLLQQYGPIPIIRENLPVFAGKDEVAVYREPTDDVFEYIMELIDEALPYLPEMLENVSEYGRITQSIAMAVKAKVAVTAASPLFNGCEAYSGFTDKRGVHLFPTQASHEKWVTASEICKAAIDICHKAGHKLYYYSNTGVSEKTRQIVQVSRTITDKWNSELIWGYGSINTSASMEEHTIPPLAANHKTFTRSTVVPTLKAVELFYTGNGVPMEEDGSYDYVNRYDVVTTVAEDRLFVQAGVYTARLHLGREARFYGSIAFDGGWWFGLDQSKMADYGQWAVNSRAGNMSGPQGTERYSATSYYIRKMANIESSYSGTQYMHVRWPFPLFRLADLYLLYAEARNEALGGPDAEVYFYIDEVRKRAGLEGVVDSWTKYSNQPDKCNTYSGMQEIIRRERSIELMFEGQRLFDIRRWNIAPRELSQPIRGWNIRESDYHDFYQILTIDRPSYNQKDILTPIRQYELTVNPNLVQNPGW